MDLNPINNIDSKKSLFTNFTENMLIIYQNDRIKKGAGRAATMAVRVAVMRRRAGPVHFCHDYILSKVNHILDTFLNWS